jgi:hypothetical protein
MLKVGTGGSELAQPEGASVWVGYGTVRSRMPTAEQALRQVLGFLELRCE